MPRSGAAQQRPRLFIFRLTHAPGQEMRSASANRDSMPIAGDAERPKSTGPPKGNETVEHPFGTLKMRMGATHFLMKTLPKVASEMERSERS